MQLSAPRPVAPLEKFELESSDPRQAQYNEAIQLRLQGEDAEGRERIEDAIQFAKWMSPNQVDVDLFVSSAPFIMIEGENNGSKFQIALSHGHSNFSVNGSPFITVESVQDRISVGKKLLTAWETLIKHLPEGFVIYGPDVQPGSPDHSSREKVLQWLGFGESNENGDRFGIVREGKLSPLTCEEFSNMSPEKGIEVLFDQRLMVEEIIWTAQE